MRKIVSVLTISLILAGCTSPRQLALFTSASSTQSIDQPHSFVIAPNDRLDIEFTAVDSAVVVMYNSAGSEFTVREDGTITLPVLGKVNLAGKNTDEAAAYLEDRVRDQVINPIVRLGITNATVTVLGEVANPSCITLDAPITLPQAIGLAGGFTNNAQLKNVLVQRTEKNTIQQYRVNLLTDQLFSSPVYYLQKGDVIDVLPLRSTPVQNSKFIILNSQFKIQNLE